MPPKEPTFSDVYQELLKRLRDAGAELLAKEIERTVARGVVLAGQETDLYQSSSVYREMNESEALAVGLEFCVTALEVPLMINDCRLDVGGESIEWRLERPGSEREEVSLGTVGTSDQQSLRQFLMKIVEITHELGISLPEVA